MNFTDRLRATQRETRSLLCIGLDPDPARLPGQLRSQPEAITQFNTAIIRATSDLVCAYKLNLAFYEALGEQGWMTLKQTLSAIASNIITIGDAKRGDIANTAQMYARSLFEHLGFTAVTVNPYLGFDSVEPFLRDASRGVFVLALTSNPGAKDFEYLKARGKPLYEHVIARVKKWNAKKNCGLVIGATHPKELQRVRRRVPDIPLLIPGIGAQGGDLGAAVRYGCDKNGELAIITSSRAIIYASNGEDFADAARAAAMKLRDEINEIRSHTFPIPRSRLQRNSRSFEPGA